MQNARGEKQDDKPNCVKTANDGKNDAVTRSIREQLPG
jgi:hypothetical protein